MRVARAKLCASDKLSSDTHDMRSWCQGQPRQQTMGGGLFSGALGACTRSIVILLIPDQNLSCLSDTTFDCEQWSEAREILEEPLLVYS